jgi:protein phosphatase
MVRDHNEDSFAIDEQIGLFVVADGMGGHAGGEMASAIAVRAIPEWVRDHKAELDGWEAQKKGESPQARILSGAIQRSCFEIHDAASKNPELQGMGTTVVSVWVHGERAAVGHVGDSRVYLFRGPQVMQVTDDHSLVNEQIKAGVITHEQARHSRFKNIITRSVGFESDVAVDCHLLELSLGDRMLLCSDGLSNFIDAAELGGVVLSSPLDEIPGRLIALANSRGGDDNITVVCLELAA